VDITHPTDQNYQHLNMTEIFGYFDESEAEIEQLTYFE
jgi:hypothetical protein